MNIFIMLAIVVANLIAIALIYQFIKKLPKMDKIIFIAASFAIVYVAVSFIYWISGFGIDNKINDTIKDFIVYIFVPVNVILLVPFIATKYNKWKQKELTNEKLIQRIIIIMIIGIIILTIETFYFKKIKQNIIDIQNNVQSEETNKKEPENEINTNETDTEMMNVEEVNRTTNTDVINEEDNTSNVGLNQNYLE